LRSGADVFTLLTEEGVIMKLKHLLKVAAVAAFTFGVQMTAQAALVSCPTSYVTDPTSKVEDTTGLHTAASACQYITPADNNYVASIANINSAGFFGHSDWTANAGNLQVGSGGATGTWSITAPNFALYDYMIVFKDGQDTNLIAFLFNELYTSGTWTTPFTSAVFDFGGGSATHDVSHYTIAQRLAGTRIPEPAPLALLGLGALALAGVQGRRKKS
jgi:hypothetical protein